MKVKAERNSSMIGTNVTADKLVVKAKGTTDIREVYNTEETESIDVADSIKGKFLGLYGKKEGHNIKTQRGNRKAAGGNRFKINKLKVAGVEDVNIEKIQVTGKDGKSRSKNIRITSSKGEVKDHAGIEYIYEETKSKTYRERHGLLVEDEKEQKEQTTGISKQTAQSLAAQKIEDAKKAAEEAARRNKKVKEEAKNKGRLFGQGIKLYDKQTDKAEIEERHQVAIGSQFYTEGLVIKSEQKKVELIGTQIDARNNVVVAGKQGVSILAASEESSKKEKHNKLEAEMSIGIKNKFLELGQAGKEAFEAYNELKAAKDAYSAYRDQLSHVEAQYKAGNLSQEEYLEYRGLEALHLASITSAGIKLASKGKNILSTTSSALLNVHTGGFSFDLQGNLEQNIDEMFAKELSSRSAAIKGNNIKIESEEGDLTLVGSHLHAADTLTLNVKNVHASAFKNQSEQKGNQKGWGANASVDVSVNVFNLATAAGNILGVSTANFNLEGHLGASENNSTSYSHASMYGKHIQLDVKGDLELRGANVHATESVGGEVKGKLLVETLQGTNEGKNYNVKGNIGIGGGLGGNLMPNVGGGFSNGKKEGGME